MLRRAMAGNLAGYFVNVSHSELIDTQNSRENVGNALNAKEKSLEFVEANFNFN